jgi:hypothetical protein
LNINGVKSNSSQQAYTLARLRREEQVMEKTGMPVPIEEDDIEDSQKGAGNKETSDLDMVDEMYENMNSFDQRLKTIKSTTSYA